VRAPKIVVSLNSAAWQQLEAGGPAGPAFKKNLKRKELRIQIGFM
jgi:hypothetical protein